jgi:hypothetical protein
MADSRILEDLGEIKSLHIAVGGNALAMGFEPQATIGLYFTGNTDITFRGLGRSKARWQGRTRNTPSHQWASWQARLPS